MAGGSVPGGLAPIFAAAGHAFGIPPSVLAGIASVESNFGANMGPSSTGAMGLMQFEPGTARSLGVNPMDARSAIFGAAKLLDQYGYRQNPTRAIGAYNGGPGNPQYGYARMVLSEAQRVGGQLGGGGGNGISVPGMSGAGAGLSPVTTQGFNQTGFDAARGRYIAGQAVQEAASSANPFNTGGSFAAGLGSGTGGLFAKGLLTSSAPNPSNYTTSKTQMEATSALQQLAGSPLVNTHAGAKGYVNPIAGAVLGRTDMGVDATLKPGAPIRAIGPSKVLGIMPGWYAGQPYLALQLTAGPQAGKVYYVAEQITPRVRPGQTVQAGQVIATFAPSGTGIEIGWASPNNWQQTLAQATGNTGAADHSNAPAGANFRSFLGSLGA